MSRRFGSQKLIYEINGIPVICRSLKNCLDSQLDEILVITGSEREKVENVIRSSFPGEERIKIFYNNNYRNGMFSSFKTGLSLLDEQCKGVMMLFGDMPYVSSDIINMLLDSWEKNLFIIPRAGGTLTHPRIVPSFLFEEFMKIPDDGRGVDIIKKYSKEVREIIFKDNGMFRDLDVLLS